MFIKVDLPEPDGPIIATYSFFLMNHINPFQGIELFHTHNIQLYKILGPDHFIHNGFFFAFFLSFS